MMTKKQTVINKKKKKKKKKTAAKRVLLMILRRFNFVFLTEDSRISKLLRRLCREDDYDHFVNLCKQLQEGILAPENHKYIKRNLDLICDNLLDILYSAASLDAKHQISKCLGRIGYVADQDFQRLSIQIKYFRNSLY